jgi:hypothetical protein
MNWNLNGRWKDMLTYLHTRVQLTLNKTHSKGIGCWLAKHCWLLNVEQQSNQNGHVTSLFLEYIPEDNTHAALLRNMVSISDWNVINIFWAVFERISIWVPIWRTYVFRTGMFRFTGHRPDRHIVWVESKGFWHWCITLRITGFFGLCPSSGILNTRKHIVSEIGSVSVLRWGEGDTYCVGSLRANLNHWSVLLPQHFFPYSGRVRTCKSVKIPSIFFQT